MMEPESSRMGTPPLASVRFSLFRSSGVLVLAATLLLFVVICPAQAEDLLIKPYGQVIKEGNPREALVQYEKKARELETTGDLRKTADVYNLCSFLAWAAGDYQKGIQFGEKAAALAQRAAYPFREGWGHRAAGLSYFQIRNYAKAQEHHERSLAIAQQFRFFQMEATAYRDLSKINRRTGNLQQALAYNLKSLAFYEHLLQTLDSTTPGDRTKRAGKPMQAEKQAKKAERIFQRKGVQKMYAGNLINTGYTYQKMNDYDAAIPYFKKALEYGSSFKDRVIEANLGLGWSYREKNKIAEALENFRDAARLSDELDSPIFMTNAHSALGRTLFQQGDFPAAEAHFKKAIDAVEDQRTLLQSGEMRSSFFEQMVMVYDGLIGTLLAQKKGREAFNYSERSRARTFLDLLGSKADLSHGKASSLIAEERELKRRMSALQTELADDDSDDAESAREELNALKIQYQQFLEKLRSEDHEHASLISVDPLKLKEVQAQLEPNQTLLQFHILKERLVLWVVSRQDVKTIVQKIKREEVMDAVRSFRTAMMDTAPGKNPDREAQALYSLLFHSLSIPAGTSLIIVPHDVLHYVPFQSLMTPRGTYLIQDHAISYLSSASLLQFTKSKRKKPGEDVLAFGNPDLGDPALNLRYAEREVKEIAGLYPNAEVFVRKEATERKAKEKSPAHSILHFATHGEFNEENPLESSLKMSPDGESSGDLTTAEVFGLKLHASLVVLSACETALGKISSGEEIVGFTRAFIYAGTPSVITTLWNVNDKTSYLLMQEFYRNLKTMGKGAALRSAQLALMKTYRHPYYWSAFVLTGDAE